MPSPAVRVHDLVAAYASAADHVMLSFENCIWLTPEPESVAESARMTVVVFVYGFPELIVTVPEGGTISAVIFIEKLAL